MRADDAATASGRPLSVLVVDDEPVLRDLTVAMVASLGHRASSAADGEQAVDAVRRGGYDLVLIDFDMPVRDGASATREMRRTADGAALPIVMVSGRSDARSIAEARAAGVSDYLVKPLRLDTLRRILDGLPRPDGRG